MQDSLFTETFDAMTAVAASSTGAYWAASSRRGEVLVWSASSQTLLQVWHAHADMIWTLMFSPDGSMLASGSVDGTVKLWDVPSGHLRETLRGHTETAPCISGVQRMASCSSG